MLVWLSPALPGYLSIIRRETGRYLSLYFIIPSGHVERCKEKVCLVDVIISYGAAGIPVYLKAGNRENIFCTYHFAQDPVCTHTPCLLY